MSQQSTYQRRPAYHLLVLGCLLSLGFWIVDSIMDTWLFGRQPFLTELLRPEPIEIYVRVLVGSLLLAFGGYAYMVGRQRARSDVALHESEARYCALYDYTPVMMHSIDTTGAIISVNRHWLDTLGYTREEVLGKPLTAFLTEASRRYATEERLPAFFQTGICRDIAYQMVRKNGEVIDVLLSAASERDASGAIQYSLAFTVDITERKRLEAQMRQGQKMEAIGTLAGGIAHEFNNILSAIIGYADLSQYEVPQGSTSWSNMQEVLKAGRRAKELVQQILAFSHPGDHDREVIPITLAIAETLTLLRATLPSTIDMHQYLDDASGTVLANRTQLHQVLLNLCTNAEYAMRDTGGVLTISVEPVEADRAFASAHPPLSPGSYVCLRVRDTGPGMPPAVVERIFDPFFTTKVIGEGTGMGLAIVHGIVTGHNGAITVESTPGVGSTFTVYLPQSAATTPTEELPPPIEDLPKGHGHLLFVDDEPMLARLGHGMLTHLGYDVEVYTSSPDALEAFRTAPDRFDLVIMDQTMPHMTGEVLTKELRRIRPDIPIILCTGFSHVMDAEKARAMGVDAFCMKPLEAHHFAMTIQQVLASRTGQEA